MLNSLKILVVREGYLKSTFLNSIFPSFTSLIWMSVAERTSRVERSSVISKILPADYLALLTLGTLLIEEPAPIAQENRIQIEMNTSSLF